MWENLGFKRLNPNNWLQPDFGPVLWPDPEGAPPGTGWLIDVLGLSSPRLCQARC